MVTGSYGFECVRHVSGEAKREFDKAVEGVDAWILAPDVEPQMLWSDQRVFKGVSDRRVRPDDMLQPRRGDCTTYLGPVDIRVSVVGQRSTREAKGARRGVEVDGWTESVHLRAFRGICQDGEPQDI